jgi:hypothetical protein
MCRCRDNSRQQIKTGACFGEINMATAGHLGIQTPRSEPSLFSESLNEDDLSLASKEASFVSPSKDTNRPGFLARLTKKAIATPLAEIRNDVRPRQNGKNEFTPLLKSALKGNSKKTIVQTPRFKSASMSHIPDLGASVAEYSNDDGTSQVEDGQSNLSISFQKLPARSPGSNEGAAAMTLREQEKVLL